MKISVGVQAVIIENNKPEFRKPMISRIGFEPSGT
jgi:hypothetical protein